MSHGKPSHPVEVRLSDLSSLPIEDPFKEKCLLEEPPNLLLIYLMKKGGSGRISAQSFDARVIEIYRLCYEKDPKPPKTRETVVRDFAAHFPHLIFQSSWLRDLIHQWDVTPHGQTSRILRALANGFRQAATLTAYKRRVKDRTLDLAHLWRAQIQRNLSDWIDVLDLKNADMNDRLITKQVTAKAGEFVKNNPHLKRHETRLIELLRERNAYDASILITAKLFTVSQRQLQRSNKTLSARSRSMFGN
ncbi:MAG: hypothetical protein HY644_04225 [Acidobacteria bacterium]|nr:hypothetical protein [Acidobacteriota bacterium]